MTALEILLVVAFIAILVLYYLDRRRQHRERLVREEAYSTLKGEFDTLFSELYSIKHSLKTVQKVLGITQSEESIVIERSNGIKISSVHPDLEGR